MNDDRLLRVIQQAGEIAKEHFYKRPVTEQKSPKDFVTETDQLLERFIKEQIRKIDPDSSFYGEEYGYDHGANKSRLYVIDPIDGTANFIFGVPYFSVSLAVLDGSSPVQAYVLNPVTGDLFYSDSECGALLNGNPISVSGSSAVSDSFVILGFSANGSNIDRYRNEWPELFDQSKKGMPLLSPSLNLCAVAMGRAEAFVDFGCSFEGMAAGAYILKQAGGDLKNYDGTPFDIKSKGVAASNGFLKLF